MHSNLQETYFKRGRVMADFTREELDCILKSITYHGWSTPLPAGEQLKLQDKIKAMIKKKCKHLFIHITEIPECILCHEIPEEFKNERLDLDTNNQVG